jgi:predicted nucleic acid-binding Zn ribbon protein
VTEPQISGVDLARVALQAAKAAAKSRPAAAAGGRNSARRRSSRPVRGDGRDPLKLGAAVTALMAERAWEAPAAAGSVIDQWAEIAPELVGKVRPVHYDADSGRLDLLPISPAYATQLRLLGRQMVARINAKTAAETVRSIRVLPPGGGQASEAEAPREQESAPPVEPGPVRTRETASAGYREALAAFRAAKPDSLAKPEIRAAVERQEQALRSRRENVWLD